MHIDLAGVIVGSPQLVPIMPHSTKKICNWPACPKVIGGKERYCAKHVEKYKQRAKEARTPSQYAWVYATTRWKELKAQVKYEEPICQACHRMPTQQIDHIVSMKAGGEPFDRSNLQGLCRSCHSSKTAREDDRWGRRKKAY